jgi:hypothetical protein
MGGRDESNEHLDRGLGGVDAVGHRAAANLGDLDLGEP